LGIDARAATKRINEQCGVDRTSCPQSYDFKSDRTRELSGFGLFVGFGVAGLGLVGASIGGIVTGYRSRPVATTTKGWTLQPVLSPSLAALALDTKW
jgi:hypothetical protein